MQHVKLARDRRKRKSRIKAMIFFSAILLILLGVILTLKSGENGEDNIHQQISPSVVENTQYQSLSDEPHITQPAPASSATDLSQEQHPHSDSTSNSADDATSYDDELQAKDDEVEEVKPEADEMDNLPEDAQNALNTLLDVADKALRITDQFSHSVVQGDTLANVLELSGLEDDTADKLIKAYPELKKLEPGQQFYWVLGKNDELEYLDWLVSEKEERIYERTAENTFVRQILEKKSQWKREILKGKINGTFNQSLKSLGLDNRQINLLSSALQWQVSLQKLKKDTPFSILVSREYLGDKLTGQGKVEAIHIVANNKSYYAIQASNGRYYNQQGETLGKGFARFPLQRQARVSSPFNLNRRHPVTGRVRPHKGVDFSVPSGTPIIAPADGMVEKIAYQSGGAGRYIVLRHSREYETVYMHLSRTLVRAGQQIKKGERIALSGNTGISTGPHLHYEFHINGRAVNPLTVKLPGTSSGMATTERRQFLIKAKEVERLLR